MDLSTQQSTSQGINHPVHRVTDGDESGASLQGVFLLEE